MSDEVKFILWSDAIRQRACSAIMRADDNSRVTIGPPRRSIDQNAKMHAMLRDMMAQYPSRINRQTAAAYNAQPLDEEGWKQAMLLAMGHKVRFLASPFDETICAVAPRTSKMTVAQCGECIEFLYAAGAEWGIEWKEPELWQHPQPIGEKNA